MLTTTDLDQMATNDEWLGFGYIGARQNMLEAGTDPEGPTKEAAAELVAKADAQALAQANRYGLNAEQLFSWANSKAGRWFGDCWFGNEGRHAEGYLPTPFGHKHGR